MPCSVPAGGLAAAGLLCQRHDVEQKSSSRPYPELAPINTFQILWPVENEGGDRRSNFWHGFFVYQGRRRQSVVLNYTCAVTSLWLGLLYRLCNQRAILYSFALSGSLDVSGRPRRCAPRIVQVRRASIPRGRPHSGHGAVRMTLFGPTS